MWHLSWYFEIGWSSSHSLFPLIHHLSYMISLWPLFLLKNVSLHFVFLLFSVGVPSHNIFTICSNLSRDKCHTFCAGYPWQTLVDPCEDQTPFPASPSEAPLLAEAFRPNLCLQPKGSSWKWCHGNQKCCGSWFCTHMRIATAWIRLNHCQKIVVVELFKILVIGSHPVPCHMVRLHILCGGNRWEKVATVVPLHAWNSRQWKHGSTV